MKTDSFPLLGHRRGLQGAVWANSRGGPAGRGIHDGDAAGRHSSPTGLQDGFTTAGLEGDVLSPLGKAERGREVGRQFGRKMENLAFIIFITI